MSEIPESQVFAEDKEANNEIPKSEGVIAPQSDEEITLTTYLRNRTPKYLRKLEHKFWNGRLATGIPNLATWTYGFPTQKGALPEGVKWGIAYTDGESSQDTSGRKWVVAFDTAAKKAYAEAGPIGPIDWNVVEVKLGLSSDKVEYVDNILGGKTIAEIKIDGLTGTAQGIFY